MSECVRKSEFARRCGVSNAAVSIGIRDGRIIPEPDATIDVERPENAIYLQGNRQRRQSGRTQRVNQQQNPVRAPRSPHPEERRQAEVDPDTKQLQIDGETHHMAELRKLVAQANKAEQEYAIRRGELVERKDVHRVFAHFYSVHTSQLKTLADKLGPDIAASLGIEVDTVHVQELMGVEVMRALSQIKKEMNDYLQKIGDGSVESSWEADHDQETAPASEPDPEPRKPELQLAMDMSP